VVSLLKPSILVQVVIRLLLLSSYLLLSSVLLLLLLSLSIVLFQTWRARRILALLVVDVLLVSCCQEFLQLLGVQTSTHLLLFPGPVLLVGREMELVAVGIPGRVVSVAHVPIQFFGGRGV